MRGKLAVSKFYFANWRRTLVRKRAWPFTALVTRGLAGIALHIQRPDLAAVLLLAFVALLRPREALALSFADIRHYAQGRRGIVFLRASKTGQRHNVVEKVVVDDPLVLAAVRLAQQRRRMCEPLYTKPQSNFGRELRELARRAGMASSRVSGYSLRRGGATWHFLTTGNLEQTAVKGRWSQVRTARIYIDQAMAQQHEWELRPATRRLLRTAARVARRVLQGSDGGADGAGGLQNEGPQTEGT